MMKPDEMETFDFIERRSPPVRVLVTFLVTAGPFALLLWVFAPETIEQILIASGSVGVLFAGLIAYRDLRRKREPANPE